MTQLTHPDPDQLSAFAEQSLPAHEHQHILAHLALCPHCREIVSLALPPEPEPIAQLTPKPRFWTILWPIATLATAVVLVVVLLHHQKPTQTASNAHPIQQPTVPTPAPVPTPRPTQPKAHPRPIQSELPTPPQPASPPAPVMLGTPLPNAAPPAPRILSAGASGQTVEVSQAASAIEPIPTTSTANVPAPAPRAILLPSGLPILSSATNARQILAIDTHNTLFLSNDAGRHWQSVTLPSSARIVRVDLTSSAAAQTTLTGTITDITGAAIPSATITLTGPSNRTLTASRAGDYTVSLPPGTYTLEATAPGFRPTTLAVTVTQPTRQNITLPIGASSETVTVDAESNAAAPAFTLKSLRRATPAQPPIFELTTDTGAHWTSTDGQTWKPR